MTVAVAKPAFAPSKTEEILRSSAGRTLVACLLLVVATLALYDPVANNNFVNFDDDLYVLGNSHVLAGLHWSTITWAFTSLEVANWHPLTWLSHALDCRLFHLNPAGHHYTSLLLHAANVLLLFLLLQQITRSNVRSFMAAALFAIHPVNVESVAWVAERKNVLAMLFFLLTLIAYARYVRKPGIGRYLLVPFLFALGLMSKPMAITLPFLLLLFDYWPLERVRFADASSECKQNSRYPSSQPNQQPVWRLCLEKFPLLALSIGSSIITMVAQKAAGAVVSSDAHPLLLRLENAIVCYVLYIGKALWPSRLAILYPYPHSLPVWEVLASALFLLGVTGAVLKYREHRYLPVGWFWYLGSMVPMIGLVQVGNQAMADRYAYLPFIGLFLMIVWGIADLAQQFRMPKPYLAGAGVIVVVALAAVTHLQIAYWHDDVSLWARALAATKNNFVADNNFGAILARQGKYEEAVNYFRAASALEPGDPTSQLNLGIYAQQHSDLKQAVARYQLVLHLTADPRIRASAYANLGQIYYAQGDYTQARENYESATKLNDPFPAPLGLIAQKTGDWEHAIAYYTQAVQVAPSDVGYLLLAQALRHSGHDQAAKLADQQAQFLSKDIHQARQTVDALLKN